MQARYLESPVEIQERDPVLDFCQSWAEFSAGLAFQGEQYKTTLTPQLHGVNLPEFVKTMPADWFEQSVSSLVSSSVIQEIADFWKSVDALDHRGSMR